MQLISNKQLVQFEYDAVYTKVYNAPEEVLRRIAATVLTYTDKAASYKNKFRKYGPSFVEEICLLENDKFYTGLLPRVAQAFAANNCDCVYKPLIEPVKATELELPDNLWEHQKLMINTALKYKRGILQSATGSGKTLTAAWFAKHFPNYKILVITPDSNILAHNLNTLEKVLGEKVGQISGKSKKWQRVTVGIVNSLYNIAQKTPELLADIDVLIVDEAHNCGNNKMYTTVCNSLVNTYYRIGFSATSWRESGDSLAMEGLLGPVLLEVNPTDLAEINVITPPNYYMVEVPDGMHKYKFYNNYTASYNTPNGKPDRNHVYYKEVVYNDLRNEYIRKVVKKFLSKNYDLPVMVLVDRIVHGEVLKDLIKDSLGVDVPLVTGKTKEAERNLIIEKMNKGEVKIIIASSVFNEGKDIQSLGMLVIAGGGQAPSRLLQQVGRTTRKHNSKLGCYVVDFLDQEHNYLLSNSISRKRAFEEAYPGMLEIEDIDKLLERIENENIQSSERTN